MGGVQTEGGSPHPPFLFRYPQNMQIQRESLGTFKGALGASECIGA